MRSSASVRSSTTATSKRPSSSKIGTPAAPQAIDQRDDYIVNLKGQIYLLSIENEMMKKSMTAPAKPQQQQQQQQQPFSPIMMGGASATSSRGGGGGAPPQAEYPAEIGDAFEVMRQKYTQLEHKYQNDLDEVRRGAEALASQCAAQSSLIATLKREIAGSSQVLVDQKTIVQRVEVKSAADLERAQRDIAHLHARIVELSDERRVASDAATATAAVIGEWKARASVAAIAAEVSEGARRRALDSYARQLIASQFLLKKWRAELWARRAAKASYDTMRAEKANAEKRALRAEREAEKSLAMAETAAAKHVEQLEAASNEREPLITQIAEITYALCQSEAGRASAEHTMRILSEQIPALSTRYETTVGALGKAESQVSMLIARGSELEVMLTSKAAEAEALRGAAFAAEERQSRALNALRGCEDSLANSHARCQALDTTDREQARSIALLKTEVESAGQTIAVNEAEVTVLRDELSRRPPIDVIKELDVENLLQRNVQAAAAMTQLLAWQSSQAAARAAR